MVTFVNKEIGIRKTQYTTFKTDKIKVVLVFTISKFVVKKISQGRKMCSWKKYLLTGTNSALGRKALHFMVFIIMEDSQFCKIFWIKRLQKLTLLTLKTLQWAKIFYEDLVKIRLYKNFERSFRKGAY